MSALADNQPAFVIHTRPYRESSLLVELLTLRQGKVSVVARGARRPNAQLRQALQPFRLLAVSYRGRSDLRTLTQAEVAEHVPAPKGDGLLCALYANELLERLLKPFDESPDLFIDYQVLLNQLSQSDDLESALRSFERSLLRHLGIWVSADQLTDAAYRFVEEEGLVPVGRGLSSSEPAIPAEYLRAIENDDFTQLEVKKAAKWLMRRMLAQMLGEKPLRSRALFERRFGQQTKREKL